MGGSTSPSLVAALARLPEGDRELLARSSRDNLSDEQLAGELHMNASEVMWRRLQLVSELAGDGGREDPGYVLTVQRDLAELPAEAWERARPPARIGSRAIRALSALRGRSSERAAAVAAAGGTAALLLLPGVLIVYLGFNGGGFFAGAPAIAAVIVLVAMVLRATLAERPFEGFGPYLAVAAGGLGLFAVLTLASAAWSGAPGRALLEFNRALLYLLVLLLAGSLLRTAARMRWMARTIALAILVVSVVGLLTRVLPEVWPIEPHPVNERLSYPLTYSNALGLLTAMGVVLQLWLASDGREPWPLRLLGAAGLPAVAAAMLLTFSRGGIAVAIIGVVAYALLARPRGLVTALLSAGPATAIALAAVYRGDLLGTEHYTSAAAIAQGEDTALVIVLCCAGALLLRLALIPLDRLLSRLQLPIPASRRRLAGVGAGVLTLVAAVVVALALGAPGYIERQYDGFVHGEYIGSGTSRERLTNPSANGRIEYWRVDRDSWERDRLWGQGAGTFQTLWVRQRPAAIPATDGHSLYLEVLAELGLAGLLLIVLAIAAVFVRLGLLARGEQRGVYAATAAVGLAWAIHAGVDWDWEMPAVTVPFFALGGLALAAPVPRLGAPGRLTRVVLGLGLLVLALTPGSIAASQSRLNASVQAFKRGDCNVAIDRALDSLEAVGARPEPYEILGYCDARGVGTGRLAVQMMSEAVERDPHNWEFHYGLALVRGAARLDPRRAAREAFRLNPHNELARRLMRGFDTASPREWERRARTARLSF